MYVCAVASVWESGSLSSVLPHSVISDILCLAEHGISHCPGPCSFSVKEGELDDRKNERTEQEGFGHRQKGGPLKSLFESANEQRRG